MKTVPISVVIPAYNSERFIGEAIECVQAQTVGVDEIIVIDNNCTDDTRKIAVDLGAKVVEETTQGIAAARNKGISVAGNDWIAFLDSDDLWEKEKIEYQWKAIEKFPEARIISCDSGELFEPGGTRRLVPILGKPEIDENSGIIIGEVYSYCPKFAVELCGWFLINSSTMIFRREIFDLVGLFDEAFLFAQDMEFVYRALARFPVATVKKHLAFIRGHDQNRTLNQDSFSRYTILAAEQMLSFPDKYTLGIPEYIIEHEKRIFLERGIRLAKKKRETEISRSTD